MYCTLCQNWVRDCICPDIDERLASIGQHPNIAIRVCTKCGRHYARCECEQPTWGIATGTGKEEEDGGNDPG